MDPVALITGGTGLIGRAAAVELAARGWRVVITSRDEARGEAVAREIAAAAGGLGSSAGETLAAASASAPAGTVAAPPPTVDVVPGDLATVRGAHDLVRRARSVLPRLDVLINNAGIATAEPRVNEDGLELTFMVNHVAPFIVTLGLLDLLLAEKRSPTGPEAQMEPPSRPRPAAEAQPRTRARPEAGARPQPRARPEAGAGPQSPVAPRGRVLNVNSGAHLLGRLDPELTPYGRDFGPFRTYAASKLANALFTVELAGRLAGTGVTVNAFHPGMFDTPVFRSAVTRGALGGVLNLVTRPFMTPRRLAGDAAAWLATEPSLVGVTGQYFNRRKRAPFAPAVADPELRRLWWEKTAELAAG